MKILLVEDDFDVARNICEFFEAEDHSVEWAPDGLIGLDSATRERHDAIVLDIALPRLSGTDLCKRLRGLGFTQVPILMLTARGELDSKIAAFDGGADDYVVKPFALEELRSRLLALVRRAAGFSQASVLKVADLELDTATLSARRSEQALSLTATARKILEALMRNTHRVVLRQELEQLVWGDDPPQSDALKIHIHMLREVVDKPFSSALIKTVRGAGYRLYASDEHD